MNKNILIIMRFLLPCIMTLLFCPSPAEACSCAFGGSAPCQEYWRTDVVFTGTALGSTRVEVNDGSAKRFERLVRFAVKEGFRGTESAEAEVVTGWGSGDCGYGFRGGESYIVYAHRDPQSKRLAAGICSRMRSLAEATEDLDFIRSLPSAEAAASVFGRVSRRNYRPKDGEDGFLGIPSAEITLEGEGTKTTFRTDDTGRYRLSGLAPGTYKVTLQVPEGLTGFKITEARKIEGQVEVVARGCAGADFYLEADTTIRGRVLDQDGQPVSNLALSIRGAPSDANNINTFLNATTDGEGRFELKISVPPGDYLLGVRIMSSSGGSEEAPYPRTYYPGVRTKAEAGVISVREGEIQSDLEMRLPPRLAERHLEGYVTWRDNRPAPGVSIYLSLMEEGEMSSFTNIQADSRGHFTLKILAGLTYKVSAFTRVNDANAQSEWADVPAEGEGPIRLVLPAVSK